MRQIFSFIFVCGLTCIAYAQESKLKPPLDTSAFSKWESISNMTVSNDGNFIFYAIRTSSAPPTLVIQSIKTKWQLDIEDFVQAAFTDDSKMVVFNKKDSLGIVSLTGQTLIKYIANATSFKLFEHSSEEWLAYRTIAGRRELILQNLSGNKQKIYTDVVNYLLSGDGNNMLLQTSTRSDNKNIEKLSYVNLVNGKVDSIYGGDKITGFCFDKQNLGVAFIASDKSPNQVNAVWYYSPESQKVTFLVGDNVEGIGSNFCIDNIYYYGFSEDGQKLFIRIKPKPRSKLRQDAVLVDIWNYGDAKLQSQQLKTRPSPENYLAMVDVEKRQVIRLQQENESIFFYPTKGQEFVFITNRRGDHNERNWNIASKPTYFLISCINGSRIPLEMYVESISPSGKYAVCQDEKRRNFYSYDISTGKTLNITKDLLVPLFDREFDLPGPKPRDLTFDTWLADSAVLIHDKFDIWQLDLSGRRTPINLTNGYGRRNNVMFRLAGADRGKLIPINKKLLLSAFNCLNKYNGFCWKSLEKKGNPELLVMGPWLYHHPASWSPSQYPIKAKEAEVYLVQRQSASQSPNYFSTIDFKSFTPITNVYSEATYNWLNAELISFNAVGTKPLSGILYKPENFNAQKKYPVIIHYYEKMTDMLNVYQKPETISNAIDVSWFVSNGYVVCTPDISYTVGEPGKSALNSILGLVGYLKKFPWVDINKIGIQGHSWGGFETNYIVTHTNIFAAAMSSSGPADFISGYGSTVGQGYSKQFFYETHQSRIGATPWERLELYIKNSPVLYAHKTNTPLLMMNNRNDGAVAFEQGIEFFTALRRLGKRAWLLQYDNEAHVLSNESNRMQHTIRMTQFFDHYLKGEPAPRWMLYGISAKDKGFLDGLELVKEKDKNGKWLTPGPGLLTEDEQKKVDGLKKQKTITITLK